MQSKTTVPLGWNSGYFWVITIILLATHEQGCDLHREPEQNLSAGE